MQKKLTGVFILIFFIQIKLLAQTGYPLNISPDYFFNTDFKKVNVVVDLFGNNKKETHFITFVAIDDVSKIGFATGHAFVCWGLFNKTSRTCNGEVYGINKQHNKFIEPVLLQPEDIDGGSITPDFNATDNNPYITLTLEVPENLFNDSKIARQKYLDNPNTNATYMPLLKDCVKFIQEIGKSIGIDMPNRLNGMYPYSYLNKLIKEIQTKGVPLGPNKLIQSYNYGVFVGTPIHGGNINGSGTLNYDNTSSTGIFRNGKLAYGEIVNPDGGLVDGDFINFGPYQTKFVGTVTSLDNQEMSTTSDNYLSPTPSYSNTTIKFKDGSTYTGSFDKNGKAEGHGHYVGPDLDYEGEYENGKQNGIGKTILANGAKYNGHFKNGEFFGEGKLILPDGSFYEGQFTNGNITGYGKLQMPDGTSLEGNFNDAELNGHGILRTSEYTYNGSFSHSAPDGDGHVEYNNNMGTFDGHFNNGNGVGERKDINGNVINKNGDNNGENSKVGGNSGDNGKGGSTSGGENSTGTEGGKENGNKGEGNNEGKGGGNKGSTKGGGKISLDTPIFKGQDLTNDHGHSISNENDK